MTNVRTCTKTVAALALASFTLAGCGNADDDPAANADDPAATDNARSEAADAATTGDPANDGAGASGDGTATLTMDDGTEYSFDMSTCKTSGSDPDSFLVEPGYDLFGKSEDGFRFSLNRSGLEEDKAIEIGLFEGHFDEGGANPEVSYAGVNDADFDLDVDGGKVTGTAMFRSSSGPSIHGENIEITFDVNC